MLWQRCCGKDVVAKMLWQWCCGKVVVAMAQLLVRSHPRPKIRDFSSGDQYSVSDENSCHPTMCFYLNVILSRAESIIKYWLTVCFHSHLEQLSIEKLCYSTLKFVYDIGGTSSPSLALRPVYKKAIDKKRTEHPVWPDWAIYCTLGNFSKPVATIILPKSPTFLGNFCKSFIFLVKSLLVNFWRLFSRHTNCNFLNVNFRFSWFFGDEELVGDELNKMNGVIISDVDPFTRSKNYFVKIFVLVLFLFPSVGMKSSPNFPRVAQKLTTAGFTWKVSFL